jgi:uncharacterized protein (TIGR03435 family)
MLLTRAYNLKPWQQLVGPAWLNSDKYDIAAKIPPGATREQVNLMLQNMLTARFGFAAHSETRDLPVYEALVAKGGPRLREPEKPQAGQAPENGALLTTKTMEKDRDGFPVLPPGVPRRLLSQVNGSIRISARMEPVTLLWDELQGRLLRPIVDKTGLTGTYDFNLTFAPDTPTRTRSTTETGPTNTAEPTAGPPDLLNVASEPASSLIAAVESQLGLKLESKKGPVEVLVVDHMNKTPTDN